MLRRFSTRIIKYNNLSFTRVNKFSSTSTAAPEEIDKFKNLSSHWWDVNGEFKALHSMNSLRIPLIQDGLVNSGRLKNLEYPQPLRGVSILDVGCGGGILCEPLARLGASVTGIDPTEECVTVAENHKEDNLDITYTCSTIEKFQEGNDQRFDVIIASEVIEHVENPQYFISVAASLLKSEGSMFLTTINRTNESFLAAIVAAEYVLSLVPRGTHQWQRFVKPEELQNGLSKSGVETRMIHGMCYNPVTNCWSWTRRKNVNYALHAIKSSQIKL